MKKYTAFFPGAQLRIRDNNEKEAFYLGLLVYDTIYARAFHLESLMKKELYKDKNDLLRDNRDDGMALDLNTYSLVEYYLNDDVDTARKLINKKILQNIYSLRSFNDGFIDDVFWYYDNDDRFSVFPSSDLFLFVCNKILNKKYPLNVIRHNIEWIQTLLQDLIISEYYKQTYDVNTIYSLSHIMTMEILKGMPTFTFSEEEIEILSYQEHTLPIYFSAMGIKKYYRNTEELFKFNGIKKDKTMHLLFSEVLPDITELPVKTICDAKRKDKFRTLPLLAENLSVSKDMRQEDIVKYFDESVWKFTRDSLKISAPEIIFNVLGQISIEPLNTAIQIFSQSNDIFSKISKYKGNGWIIPISELREKINNIE